MISNTLSVKHLVEDRIIIEGEFYGRIIVDDSIWNIDGNNLILTLEKLNEDIWKTVFKGDEQIDTIKGENNKNIDQLNSETQVI